MSSSPGLLRRIDQTGVPILVARLVLGGMFIYLGCMKLKDPVAFLKLIREYDMIPAGAYLLLNLSAAALPWVEILCGVFLLLGTALRGTGVLLVGMLGTFNGALILRALKIFNEGGVAFCDIRFDCGCGTGEVFICSKLLENFGLFALAILVIWSKSRTLGLGGNLIPGRWFAPRADDQRAAP